MKRKPRKDIGVLRKRGGTESPCEVCLRPVYSYPSRTKKYCGNNCRDIARILQHYDPANERKKCGRCGEWKPFRMFIKQPGTPFGLHSYCGSCNFDWCQSYRGVKAEDRPIYKPRKAPMTKEQRRIRRNERAKESRKRRHYKITFYNRLRMHKLRAGGAMPDKWEIQKMLCMQDARCVYCSTLLETYHIDHKIPVSRKGTNDISNLQLLCPPCNIKKRDRTHDEYLQILGRVV